MRTSPPASPADVSLAAPRIAVLVPCFNEAITVQKVVRDFQEAVPGAVIYVFDNNSTDDTARLAAEAGAVVVPSPRQGKGYVVQHMFATVDADLYLMADGDDTYDASAAPALLEALRETDADMVVGARLEEHHASAFRRFHLAGNHLVSFLISTLFRTRVTDALSGYRGFTREFVKTIPIASGGFVIETELTLSALSKGFSVREIPVPYGTRPEGSTSKLDTWSDGVLILASIALLFKDYRPLTFFTVLAGFFAALSLAAAWAPVMDYVRERYVYHVPLAVLAAALGLLSALAMSVGLVLSTIARYHIENFQLVRRALQERR